ncbi:MAG TPA: metalloregulator ArsR/SmtB family transcription factor [Chloroflexota bacterium]|nr:metalloregulator ArsR/SmtB family transcription factor [Chloroflexota bacterium]
MRPITGLTRRDVLASRCCEVHPLPLADDKARDEARFYRALGDETRLQIVRLLAQQTDPLCVCHLEASFELSQPTISHHLKVLREAGLVTTERHGVWIYYQLDRERFQTLRDLFEAVER